MPEPGPGLPPARELVGDFARRWWPVAACAMVLLLGMLAVVPLLPEGERPPDQEPHKVQEILRTSSVGKSAALLGTFVGFGLIGLLFAERLLAGSFAPLDYPAVWGWGAVVVGLGYHVLEPTLNWLCGYAPGVADPEAPPVVLQLAASTLAGACLLGWARLAVRGEAQPLAALGLRPPDPPGRVAWTTPVLMLLAMPFTLSMVCLTALIYVLIGRDIDAQEATEVMAAAGPLTFAALAIYVVIVAPLVEEVLFRGLMLGKLLERMSPMWALGVSALLFALVHRDPSFMPSQFATGVVMGLVRLRTGTLTAPIALHAGFNLLMVVLLLFAGEDPSAAAPPQIK